MTSRNNWLSSFDFSLSNKVKLKNKYSQKLVGKSIVGILID